MHFHIQLLLFAHEHNERHSCAEAYHRYSEAQRVPFTLPDLTAPLPADLPLRCEPEEKPVQRKRKAVNAVCAEVAESELPAAHFQSASSRPAASNSSTAVGREFLACERVIVNEASRTVHQVEARVGQACCVRCSWVPPFGSRSLPTATLAGRDLYSCGVCFGQRNPLLLG